MNDLVEFFNTLSIQFGASHDIPTIILTFGDKTVNILSMLEDRQVMYLITSLKDLCGNILVISTIFGIALNLPKLLDGAFYGCKIEAIEYSEGSNYSKPHW